MPKTTIGMRIERTVYVDLPMPPNFLRLGGRMVSVGSLEPSEAAYIAKKISEQFEEHCKDKRRIRETIMGAEQTKRRAR